MPHNVGMHVYAYVRIMCDIMLVPYADERIANIMKVYIETNNLRSCHAQNIANTN